MKTITYLFITSLVILYFLDGGWAFLALCVNTFIVAPVIADTITLRNKYKKYGK